MNAELFVVSDVRCTYNMQGLLLFENLRQSAFVSSADVGKVAPYAPSSPLSCPSAARYCTGKRALNLLKLRHEHLNSPSQLATQKTRKHGMFEILNSISLIP